MTKISKENEDKLLIIFRELIHTIDEVKKLMPQEVLFFLIMININDECARFCYEIQKYSNYDEETK